MKRKWIGLILLLVLMTVTAGALADWGSSGKMVSPAGLVLAPESILVDRFQVPCDHYEWSYAKFYFRPEEIEESSLAGGEPTDPGRYVNAETLMLPGATGFEMKWICGWNPEKVSLRAWKKEVLDHPDNQDAFFLGNRELPYGRVVLEPDRVYSFRAEWGEDSEVRKGTAEYYVVTGQMTEAEIAEGRARAEAPYSEQDLQLLTMKITGVDCVLGQTTPKELEDQGVICFTEMDGSVAITDENGYGFIYAQTEDDSWEKPIIHVNAFWSYDMPLEYLGFQMNEEMDDAEDAGDDEPMDDDDDDDDSWMYVETWWDRMASMQKRPIYVDESVEGIYSTVLTLSNGRELYVDTHGYAPGMDLLPPKAVRPLAVSEWNVDTEAGSYDLRITGLQETETESWIDAKLYQEDHYTRDELNALRVGDWVEINGEVRVVSSVENEDGILWIGYEDGEDTEYFAFRESAAGKDLCYASSTDDWVCTTYLKDIRIPLPLPENFVYIQISAGEEVEQPAEKLLQDLREKDLSTWSQYNTSITFRDNAPVSILHSGYPTGPDQ